MLTLDEYQKQAGTTDISGGELWYYGLGLAGETGEAVEEIKKYYRRIAKGEPPDLDGLRTRLRGELGDIAWYLARAASWAGLSLDDIVAANLVKLAERKANGTLSIH